jgi:hypothetical protein
MIRVPVSDSGTLACQTSVTVSGSLALGIHKPQRVQGIVGFERIQEPRHLARAQGMDEQLTLPNAFVSKSGLCPDDIRGVSAS